MISGRDKAIEGKGGWCDEIEYRYVATVGFVTK